MKPYQIQMIYDRYDTDKIACIRIFFLFLFLTGKNNEINGRRSITGKKFKRRRKRGLTEKGKSQLRDNSYKLNEHTRPV